MAVGASWEDSGDGAPEKVGNPIFSLPKWLGSPYIDAMDFRSLAKQGIAIIAVGWMTLIPVHGINIHIDYSLDAGGFFNQSGAKEAMEAVAEFFEERITDSLLAIDQDAFVGNGQQ